MICETYVHLPLCIQAACVFKYTETNWTAFRDLATLFSHLMDDVNKQQVRVKNGRGILNGPVVGASYFILTHLWYSWRVHHIYICVMSLEHHMKGAVKLQNVINTIFYFPLKQKS